MRRRVRMVDLARRCAADRSLAGGWACWVRPSSRTVTISVIRGAERGCPMRLQGASVVVTDPKAVENARRAWTDITFAVTAQQAAQGADVVLLPTEWADYRELDPEQFGSVVAHRRMRRSQRAGPGALARRRLDLPRSWPAVAERPLMANLAARSGRPLCRRHMRRLSGESRMPHAGPTHGRVIPMPAQRQYVTRSPDFVGRQSERFSCPAIVRTK